MTAQPRAEMLTIMFVMLGLWLSQQDKASSYSAAFFASLTRYEGVFMIPSIAVKDIIFSKRRKIIVFLCILSLSGIAVWILLNYYATGNFNPYYQYFGSDTKAAGIDYVRITVKAVLGFIPLKYSYDLSGKFFIISLLSLTSVGFYTLFKTSIKDSIPLFSFFVSCTLLNLIFFSPTMEHAFITIWIFILCITIGLTKIFSVINSKTGNNFSIISLKPSKKQSIIFYILLVIISFIGMYKMKVKDTEYYIKIFFLISQLFSIWFVFVHMRVKNWTDLLRNGFLIILLIFINGKNIKAINHKMNSTKYNKAEVRLVGEWYNNYAELGDKIVLTEPWVAAYYADDSKMNDFIFSGDFKAKDWSQFINELKEGQIKYIAWSTADETLASYYCNKYKIYLFSELSKGKDSKHFRLIKTLTIGPKKSYIYEIN